MDKKAPFQELGRAVSGYRPVSTRLRDWREIQPAAGSAHSSRQATRCMDCGVPFCQSTHGCPVENEIPRWNELVARGLWREALDLLHSTNNFPEFTGRLCPAPCESACVLGLHSDSVTIKEIELAIVERGFEQGWIEPQPPSRRTGKRVAIVGSGPAGLAAAQELARRGHAVTVFEKAARAGGLLRYGIPDFKLEKWRIDRRLQQLEREGVRFQCSTTLGRDFTLGELRRDFDAVGLAVGAEQPRDLPVPGRELDGVHLAMDYLTGHNRHLAGEAARAPILAAGKQVVILGGGDTGSDCLGTALREGARSVRQFEILPRPPEARDSSTPWPAWPLQLRSSHAHEEGGSRDWSLATKRFLGSRGRVEALVAERVGEKGAELVFPAELVILALGFTGTASRGLEGDNSPTRDARGNVTADRNFMTSVPGVFVAGDAKRGASLIVWAIAEGRNMAAGIGRYLNR